MPKLEKSKPEREEKGRDREIKIGGKKQQIDIGGGAYIAGKVDTGGGDFVGRDAVTIGDISDSRGIAIGKGAKADEVTRLFWAIYEWIEARREDPDVDKEELTYMVRRIEKEVARGEHANPNKVERWLRALARMAPDVLQITTVTLADPLVGVASTIRKIAEKTKAESVGS